MSLSMSEWLVDDVPHWKQVRLAVTITHEDVDTKVLEFDHL